MSQVLNNEVDILNVANIDNDIRDSYTRAMIAGEEKETYCTRQGGYDVNEFFIWSDRQIYKTKAAISQGDTFVLNTNIELAGTLSDQMYQLFSQSPESMRAVLSNIENGSTASRNFVKGEYILWTDGFLYEVTANTNIGTAWTVGTNITKKNNITDEITSVKSVLSNKLYTKRITSVADMPASKDFYDLDDGYYYVTMAVINSNQTVNTPPISGGCELLVSHGADTTKIMETCFPFDTRYPIYIGWSNTNSADFKWTAKLVSNPNLLDNPWFTVNQRGSATYTTTGYCVDRWYKNSNDNSGHNIILGDTGVTLTNTKGDVYTLLGDKETPETGKEYTLSAIIDGTIYSYTFVYTGGSSSESHVSPKFIDNMYIHALFNWGGTGKNLIAFNNSQTTVNHTIKAMKLERGTVSTLAQDTAPNYAEELLKCQRYCVALNPSKISYSMVGSGFAYSTTEIDFVIPVPVTMRANPSAVDLTNWRITDGPNWTSISSISLYRNAGSIKAVLSGLSGLTQGKPYFIASAGNNADLMLITADL